MNGIVWLALAKFSQRNISDTGVALLFAELVVRFLLLAFWCGKH